MKTVDHECIMLSTEQQLELWFDNLLSLIDEGHVIQAIRKNIAAFDFIDADVSKDFIDKLSNDELRVGMKTEKWKKSLLQTAIRVYQLESRFQ